MNAFSKLASLTLIAAGAMGLAACTDGEVVAGAAGAAGGIIIGSSLDHHHDHGYGGGGYYGGGYYGGGYHHGYHGYSVNNTDATGTAVPVKAFQSADKRVQHVAENYEISDYAATYVVRAFLLAQKQDMSGITDMGLTTSDFSDMSQGKDLAPDKIQAMSKKLQMSPQATKALSQDLQNDIQEELNAQQK